MSRARKQRTQGRKHQPLKCLLLDIVEEDVAQQIARQRCYSATAEPCGLAGARQPYGEYDVALGSLRRALDRLRLRRRSGGHIRLGFHLKSAGIGWLIPLLLHGAVLLRSPLWRGRTIEWGRSLWRCGALWRCRPPGLAWRPLCANLRRHYGRPLTTIFSDGSRSTRRSAFSGQGLVWIEGHQGARLIRWEFLANFACGF